MSRHRGRTGCQLASMVFCVCGCGQWTSAALCPLRMLCIVGEGLAAFALVKAVRVVCSRCHCIPSFVGHNHGECCQRNVFICRSSAFDSILKLFKRSSDGNRTENKKRNCTIWGKVILKWILSGTVHISNGASKCYITPTTKALVLFFPTMLLLPPIISNLICF